MTGRLSDYDQGLLDQIGLFADTRIAEQVRAVMVARNNAEAQLAEARQRIVARQDIIAGLLDSVSEERRRADAAEARLEAVKMIHRPVGRRGGPTVCDDCLAYTSPMPTPAPWPCRTAAALSVAPQPEPAVDVTRLIDPELAHGWQSSEKEMRKLRAALAAARDGESS
jgi:hypothetical protein